MLAKPWSPIAIPRINLDDSAVAEALRTQIVRIDDTIRTATARLVSRNQATMGEVLQREAVTPAELTAQGIRCAFGYNTSGGDGCAENVAGVCGPCSAHCCQFHLDHNLHKDVVPEKLS